MPAAGEKFRSPMRSFVRPECAACGPSAQCSPRSDLARSFSQAPARCGGAASGCGAGVATS